MTDKYRLPDRSMTTDLHKFEDAWYSIILPIERKYGVKCLGFDPQISFYDHKSMNGSFDIPVWFAQKLAEDIVIAEKLAEAKEDASQ